MGLDISAPCDTSFRAGSYSGFSSFREWLSKKAGYKGLDDWFEQNHKKMGEFNNNAGCNRNSTRVFLGPLLAHSDCEGYITFTQAKYLLNDLQTVKNKLPNIKEVKQKENEKYYRQSLDNWIKACKEVVEYGPGEKLEFC